MGLIVAGFVQIWSLVRPLIFGSLERDGEALVAESVLVMPWLAFPVLLLTGLIGWYKPALALVQAVCLFAGAAWLLRKLRRLRRPRLPRLGVALVTNALALAAVSLFSLWSWAMPTPESFNGHYDSWINQLSDLSRTGTYHLVSAPSADTHPLVEPAMFVLAPFTVPWLHEVWLRPMMFATGLFAFCTLLLLRATAAQVSSRWIGSLAFLLIAFNYYTAGEFSEISSDLVTASALTYFGYRIMLLFRSGRFEYMPFLFLLGFSLVFRKQLFVLLAVAMIVLAAFQLTPWRSFSLPAPRSLIRQLRARAAAVLPAAAVLLPCVCWLVLAWVRYGNPGAPDSYAGVSAGSLALNNVGALFADAGPYRYFLLEHFFPIRDWAGFKQLGVDVFAGLSVSLLVALCVLAFLLLAGRMRFATTGLDTRVLRRIVVAYLIAFFAVAYFYFAGYAKFSHYVIYLVAIFAAILISQAARWRAGTVVPMTVALLAFGTGATAWAYQDWFHEVRQRPLTNIRFLWPTWGTPVDRVARKSARSVASLDRESLEYLRAVSINARTGERTLHSDQEPGALVPTILDREYEGDFLYLEHPRAARVVAARDCRALEHAFRSLRIGFVYRPRRPHQPNIEESYLMKRLNSYEGRWQYVVPVREVCHV